MSQTSHCNIKGLSVREVMRIENMITQVNPLRPNNDLSQTSHCNIKGLSMSEAMRIENMITQVKFY